MKLPPLYIKSGNVDIRIEFAEDSSSEYTGSVPLALQVDLQRIPPEIRTERIEQLTHFAAWVAQEVDRLFA